MILAQGRPKNDVLHLYDGQNKKKDIWGTDYIASLCGHVRFNNSDRENTYQISDKKAAKDYLIEGGDIQGKICSNCQKSL